MRKRILVAITCTVFFALGLDLCAEAGAEIGVFAEPDATGIPLGYYLGLDASLEGLLDDNWAYRAFLDAEGSYDIALGALASGGIALSLRTEPLDWVLEIGQNIRLYDGIVSFPRSGATLRIIMRLGDDVLGIAPYAMRDLESDMPGIETGADAWYETVLGPVVIRPGLGAAARFLDEETPAFVLRPGGRISFYPEIPFYVDFFIAWITDLVSNSFETSFNAAWVPFSAFDLSAGGDIAFEDVTTVFVFRAKAQLDILRDDNFAMILPAEAVFDSDGNLTLTLALRFELP